MEDKKPIGFDPMTGDPIYAPSDPEVAPAAEEPVQSEVTVSTESPAQPVEPVAEVQPVASEQPTSNPQPIGYDPMTGAPIYENAQPVQKQIGFDPMTGAPVYSNNIPSNIPSDIPPKKKSSVGLIVGGCIGGVAVVAAIVAVGIFSGAFLSAKNKVAKATIDTFAEQSELTKTVNNLYAIENGDFTMTVNGSVEGNDAEFTMVYSDKKKQIAGSMDIESAPEIEFNCVLDDKALKAYIPLISDDVYVYNYTEEPDGYLADVAEDELEMISQYLEFLSNMESNQDDVQKTLTKGIKDIWKDVECKKLGTQEFEVDGKDRKCKGYTITITEDQVNDLIDVYEDTMDTYFEQFSEIDEFDDMLDDLHDSFEELRDEVDDMDDIDIDFYLYKGKLACIATEADDEELQILFKGGKTRTENIEILVDDETVLEIEGETSKNVQTLELKVDGDTMIEFEYDSKSGDFEISGSDDFPCSISGVMKGNAKEFTISVDEVEVYDESFDVEGEIVIKKGADFIKLDGDEVDIMDLDEDDFYDIISELYDL